MTNLYELDGTLLRDRETAHDHLQQALGFPEWYGKNLDALYDMLTAYGAPTMIFVTAADDIDPAIAQVFADAETENPMLTVAYED